MINKDHILLTIFGTENGRPYLVDFKLAILVLKIYFHYPKMISETLNKAKKIIFTDKNYLSKKLTKKNLFWKYLFHNVLLIQRKHYQVNN